MGFNAGLRFIHSFIRTQRKERERTDARSDTSNHVADTNYVRADLTARWGVFQLALGPSLTGADEREITHCGVIILRRH